MSRARERSLSYVVADDVEQANKDLVRDWSAERRQRWAIDSGTPASHPLEVERDEFAPAELRTSLRRARLSASARPWRLPSPADPSFELRRVKVDLAVARRDIEELQAGRGRHQRTEVGRAVRDEVAARAYRAQAERYAASPGSGWRDRRAYRREAEAWAEREADASARFERLGGPGPPPGRQSLPGPSTQSQSTGRGPSVWSDGLGDVSLARRHFDPALVACA